VCNFILDMTRVAAHQLTSELCADMHWLWQRTFADVSKCCDWYRIGLVGQQWADGRQLTIVHSQCWPCRQWLVGIQRVVDVVALHIIRSNCYTSHFNHWNVACNHKRYLNICCHAHSREYFTGTSTRRRPLSTITICLRLTKIHQQNWHYKAL